MLFASVVEVSKQVSGTPKRLQKIDLLAQLLKQLDPEEVEIAVAYLSGYTRQGRMGIGYATLRNLAVSAAEAASLQIRQVDRALSDIAAVQGPGSESRRRELLGSLMGRAN